MHVRQGKKSHSSSVAPVPRPNVTKHQSSTGRTFAQLKANHDFPMQSILSANIVPPVVGNDDEEFSKKRKYDNSRVASTLPVSRNDEVKQDSNTLFTPIPTSVTQKPKAKKKKKAVGPTTISELVQQTEQERLEQRGLNAKPEVSTSSSSSTFSFHASPPKANGYNARKQSNLAEIAAQETPRRKR